MSIQRNDHRTILVYADWIDLNGPILMGVLSCSIAKRKETFSFEYDPTWLASKYTFMLDPDLQLYPGQQYVREEKSNFGMFMDSSPDRWGTKLMIRREAIEARKEDRKVYTLQGSDLLLGVYDQHRMGALRFKLDPEGPFLDDNEHMPTPPMTALRALEAASKKLEDDQNLDDPNYSKWLSMLIAPGGSLGGARPKSGVIDPEGLLWIAKFPSQNDDYNLGGWEWVTAELASACGINVSKHFYKQFSGKHYTFITERFDRTPKGNRIHFASAMTLLGLQDGADHHSGASYINLAEFLSRHGAKPNQDLEQLWRRIIFNICVSNTDDHLRNHGFLLTEAGWILSPAYDVNPTPTGSGLTLNISEDDNSLDVTLALEVAAYFRLDKKKSYQIAMEVAKTVLNWTQVADKAGISKGEQEMMSPAFAATHEFLDKKQN
jgi:serine/threonine-protein kinase HipA